MLTKIKVYDLCEEFEKALIERNYNPNTLYRYKKALHEFKEFTGDVLFSPNHSAVFLIKVLGKNGFTRKGVNSNLHMFYIRTVRSIEDYYVFGTFLRRHDEKVPMSWPEQFRMLLTEYFLTIEIRGITIGSQRRIGTVIKDLILYLYRHDIYSFSEMTNNHVTGFIISQVGYHPRTMAVKVSCLRGLFKFLYLEGHISRPLFMALPKVQNTFRTSIPTVWKPEELQRVKESIDLGNPTGKRDYAIVMFVASTGLRAGDIVNLKLSDIDWEKKEISITQKKSKEPLTLPLMDSVGWALIDYIKNARPDSSFNNVFLRHLPPFEPFKSTSAFYTLLTKYVSKAGVKPGGKSKVGIHSLRHTVACELLQNNVEINTIADILGHLDPESTKNYLKVNILALSRCTLEVIFDGE